MRSVNREFYLSRAWRDVSRLYMTSQNYICERCGAPATICHHKIYLNSLNVNDPTISLNPDNLEALCHDCHNKEHSLRHTITHFDQDGNVVGVKKSGAEKQFESDRKQIDRLLSELSSKSSI